MSHVAGQLAQQRRNVLITAFFEGDLGTKRQQRVGRQPMLLCREQVIPGGMRIASVQRDAPGKQQQLAPLARLQASL
ncbi:MAG TPA: hypothetical protein VJS90_02695, partial [Pseudomonas sp.]|uniref:hypothetical protein n=1 Tax=Pseudomonas sp. TaxID=306 RepID=UPI002B4A26D1